MTRQQIRELALANGFKLKEQEDGYQDLNEYVYTFAKALIEADRIKQKAGHKLVLCNRRGREFDSIFASRVPRAGETIYHSDDDEYRVTSVEYMVTEDHTNLMLDKL